MADYSIWVVEYARVNEFARGLLLYGQWNTGTTIAPYCYAVLKSDDHLAVIDSGYNHTEFGKVLAESYGVSDWQPDSVMTNPSSMRLEPAGWPNRLMSEFTHIPARKG